MLIKGKATLSNFSMQTKIKNLFAIFLTLIRIFELHNKRREKSLTTFFFTTRNGRLITHGILVEHKTVKNSIPALFILLFVPHPFAFISWQRAILMVDLFYLHCSIISTEGALRRPLTYDNHPIPSHPSAPSNT